MSAKKKVTLVGCGALGSHCAILLRNEADLKIIDYDRVEAKNCLSQAHAKSTIGKLKTEGFKQTMSFLWGTKLETNSNKLVDNNAEALLGGANLIIDCLDNAVGRKVIQAWAKKTQTPCLHGALAPNGEFGRVIWLEDFKIDDEAGAGQATCEDGAFLPFISIVASYLARSAQLFLRENKKTGWQISPVSVVRV